MDYSASNSLKTLVTNVAANTIQANVNLLTEGEIGFFTTTTGALAASGAGYFAMKKNGVIIRSLPIANFGGWAGLKSYTAPAMKISHVTVPTPVVGEAFQAAIEIKIPGMRGETYIHGNFVAQDTVAANVATGLIASLNYSLTKMGATGLVGVTLSTADIVVTEKLQPYVKGKVPFRRVDFKLRLTQPSAKALLETQDTAHSDGIGYGPMIVEQEYFAQGDSDQYRFIGWRNNFEFTGNALVTGKYNVLLLTEDTQSKTANARVDTPVQYLIAFNTVGNLPAPVITAADDSDNTVVGTSFANAVVYAYKNGSTTSAANATANGAGAFSISTPVVAGESWTVKATLANYSDSLLSNAMIAVT